MQRSVTLKSLFLLAAFTLGTSCARAEDGRHSFEDGLKDNTSLSTERNKSEYREGRERSFEDRFEHRFDNRFDNQHAFEGGSYHHHGLGGGISVSPVSEPATDAMMLGGLVLLLTLARRKSKARGV